MDKNLKIAFGGFIVVLAATGLALTSLSNTGFSNSSDEGPGPVNDTSNSSPEQNGQTQKVSDWKGYEIEDISTGEEFSISDLEKPVLVENFAVWCGKCTNQQKAVKTFHQKNPEIESVALNIDQNEQEEKVRNHIERFGFDWKYAIAPAEMSQKMAERHGQSMLVPPRVPLVLVCEDGERMLSTGGHSASELEQEVEQGC